jgi:Outer membrane protein beta-barrel domain
MPRRISKGISMSGFKSVITLCVLLLLMTITYEYASAQSNESKFEVGAQFSVLGGRDDFLFGSPTSVGGGARLTYNLMKYLALEGEMNLFPRRSNNAPRYQGQFGMKTGMRFDRFGVFGKVRPGFVNTYENKFSLDLGGVLEFYPSRRLIVRFDIGDTIVNLRKTYVISGIFPDRVLAVRTGSSATHNLQMGAGVGFRF